MAFDTAAGYGNLPSGNFTPEIFSQKVLKFFRRASVVEDITNTDYAGEIENFGDTVRIIKEPTITVSAYSRGAVVNPQDLADDQITMVVDQANAFAFKIDDIEERQSHVNFEALATSSGAFSLKRKYDANVLTQMVGDAGLTSESGATVQQVTGLGTVGTPFDLNLSAGGDGDNAINLMLKMARALDDQSIGNIAGMNCYKTTALNDSGTDIVTLSGLGSGEFAILAGHMSSTATASHIAKTEVVRSTETFSDIVRGLHVFGRKVLRPEALVRGVVTFA